MSITTTSKNLNMANSPPETPTPTLTTAMKQDIMLKPCATHRDPLPIPVRRPLVPQDRKLRLDKSRFHLMKGRVRLHLWWRRGINRHLHP